MVAIRPRASLACVLPITSQNEVGTERKGSQSLSKSAESGRHERAFVYPHERAFVL
jgi:hypothetical protein